MHFPHTVQSSTSLPKNRQFPEVTRGAGCFVEVSKEISVYTVVVFIRGVLLRLFFVFTWVSEADTVLFDLQRSRATVPHGSWGIDLCVDARRRVRVGFRATRTRSTSCRRRSMRKWELYTFLHSERNDFSSSLYLGGLHFHLQTPPPPILHL